jgi:hypothetical protein
VLFTIICVREDEAGKDFRRAFVKRLFTKATRSCLVKSADSVDFDGESVFYSN